jgi:predicted phosphoribosyltransferase
MLFRDRSEAGRRLANALGGQEAKHLANSVFHPSLSEHKWGHIR